MSNVALKSQEETMRSTELILLKDIQRSLDCQPREAINTATVTEYAEQMTDGAAFPPVVIFKEGKKNWLADGFHRVFAAEEAGITEIEADVRLGTKRDAMLFSCGANAKHGLRRTNEDKRRAVLSLLNDEEWSQWSDSEVAKQCGVSHPFVGKLRKSDTCNVTSMGRTFTHPKTGKPATMKTDNIGKSNVVEVDFVGEDLSEEIDDFGRVMEDVYANPEGSVLRKALDVIRGFCGLKIDKHFEAASKEELTELDQSINRIMRHCELLKKEIARCA